MVELSPEQDAALQIAHNLVDLGVPIFTARPDSLKGEFIYPDAWQTYRPHHRQVEMWRPGSALCMVTGVVFDVLDVDPRNGGEEGWTELQECRAIPTVWGEAQTPSAGRHYFIARTRLAKCKAAKGVDLQAGDQRGEGRGFVFIAPTVRVSKFGPNVGQPVAYRWESGPELPTPEMIEDDAELDNLVDLIERAKAPRRPSTSVGKPVDRLARDDDDPWDLVDGSWTASEASKVIEGQLAAVQAARAGQINDALGGAARVLGRFVAGGFMSEDEATFQLMFALGWDGQRWSGVHSDAWNAQNGRKWTAATVIGAGLANGAKEPWTVEAPAPMGGNGAAPGVTATEHGGNTAPSTPSAKTAPSITSVTAPGLAITSGAESAYWLQNQLGAGPLAGFFLRGGQVAHTPRVDELGYVEPRADADDNGPAQIQAVNAGQLTAKIQFAYRCYKTVKDKESGETSEVPALFPLQAAQRAVDAPEAMVMLRGLNGITMTPMVRADGTVLERPGYDPVSRYLFLPGPGVNVRGVPEAPTPADLEKARALLDEMLAGFPWESQDDLANYMGLLLTPMLRLACPPSYKMFGITAHQPASGKTLLADVATVLHGGVLRSEMPEDEAEMRKQTTSILSTTSAPVVHIDNVTGVLRSSTLAGLLTASAPLTDRELGSSRMITTVNDRTWVVTGNNLSLGGDLVRRTILISIDPNMANPESRDFPIKNLQGWVAEHRNDLLWSLLVMIRAWVAAGRPMAQRAQSDSFATWEASVAGILAVCGYAGNFDDQSGKRAAAGGDDDGLAALLERIWQDHENRGWTVATILEGGPDEWSWASQEWLPSPVLDKLARSLAAGKKTMGYWLRNRLGRWVSGSDGHSYVIREDGKEHGSARWRIERTP